jgi:hypothetical protein
MELKNLIAHFTYRIEPKPGGGFVAHASDPTMPPLEAPTREELQQQIQAHIAATLAAAFPGLKLPQANHDHKFAFHIEHKPGAGFTIHSADPNAAPIEGKTQEAIESHFAEKLINFVGTHFMPELSRALAGQNSRADIKVSVRKTFAANARSQQDGLRMVQGDEAAASMLAYPAEAVQQHAGARQKTMSDANLDSIGSTISNLPITPEPSGSFAVIRVLVVLFIFAGLVYLVLYRH